MCLEKISEKIVATEDIVCYKQCRQMRDKKLIWNLKNIFRFKWILDYDYTYKTPFYYMEVELGKTYTSVLQVDQDGTINKGLHSYANKVDTGFYALIECVIPKGATYYKGIGLREPGYASDKLRYVKLIKKFERI